jgi:putative redox protein
VTVDGLGVAHGEIHVRVHLEREQSATRFRYELILDPALEPHRPAVTERIERSPVRVTLSKHLMFEPA